MTNQLRKPLPITVFTMAIDECEGVNLDREDQDDLMEFWLQATTHPIAVARALFPSRPDRYIAVTLDLAVYASNKATAMTCRTRGDISGALLYEGICDRIYRDLPEFARW